MMSLLQSLLLYSAITVGAVYTMFNPILFPEYMVDGIESLLQTLWLWADFLPVQAFLNSLYMDMLIFVAFIAWKVIFGSIAGKPEID